MAITLKIEVYDSFDRCEDELRSIYHRTNTSNPFLSVDWLKLWWEHFGRGNSLLILLFREGKKSIGFAPLYKLTRKYLGLTEIHILGAGFSSYLDVVSEAGYERLLIDSLIDYLKNQVSPIIFHCYDINIRFSSCFKALKEKLSDNEIKKSYHKLYPCPLAFLGNDWGSYFKNQRDKKSRYNLKRAERQFHKLGYLKLHEINSPEKVHTIFPKIYQIHKERFKKTENSLFRGKRKEFVLSLLERMSGDEISLSIMELDNIPISFLIGFKMGEIFVDFAPGFDPAFSPLSLGHIHLKQLIEKKIQDGFKYFDFSKGEADYKRWWSNDETTNYSFLFGINLNKLINRYFDILTLIIEFKSKLRSKGFNQNFKNYIGRFRQKFFYHKNIIKIDKEKINKLSDYNLSKYQKWSYHIIHNLPDDVRKTVIKCLLDPNISNILICSRPKEKVLGILSLNNNLIYTIHY